MWFLAQPVVFRSFDEGSTFTINDQTSLKAKFVPAPHYYISVDTADGFYSTDIENETHPIPHAIGEVGGDSYRRGKGINLAGVIQGRNVIDMIKAANYLRQMFWEVKPRKLVWTEIDGTEVYLKCRVLNDVAITEVYDRYNPLWQWTVGLRADDPRPRKESDDTLLYSWQSS